MLREETEGEYLELARKLHVCSVLVIPVTLSSSLATVTFMMTLESGRRYGEEDVAIADELVTRAAQVVDNARVHQRLRKTEERFRVALAHSNITLFEQDEELRYRWIYNPPLGFRAADVLGRTNGELVSPEEAARMGALDRAVLASGERIQDEVPLTTPGGETRHLLSRKSRGAIPRARSSASSGPPRTSRNRSERTSSSRGRSYFASR